MCISRPSCRGCGVTRSFYDLFSFTVHAHHRPCHLRRAHPGCGAGHHAHDCHRSGSTYFILGFFEVAIWLTIISVVLAKIQQAPVLGIFYALGYATGTVVGIALEKKVALGQIVIRAIVSTRAEEAATALRDAGFGVTTFFGQGMHGAVTEILVAGLRKETNQILNIIRLFDANPFYILEQAGSISKIDRPPVNPFWYWVSVLKGK